MPEKRTPAEIRTAILTVRRDFERAMCDAQHRYRAELFGIERECQQQLDELYLALIQAEAKGAVRDS